VPGGSSDPGQGAVVMPAGPGAGRGASSVRSSVVLVDDFVYIERPYNELAPVLMDPRASWLKLLASAVGETDSEQQETALSERAALIRLGRGPRRLRPLAVLSTGLPRRTDKSVIVPIRWSPVSLEFMLPTVEGDLDLTRLDRLVSRVELRGSYRVPLKRLGESLDRLAMHRAAEAGAREFLYELSSGLSRAEPPEGDCR
jgi:hypothetical protein